MNKTSRDITSARKHLVGCNVTTCPDPKCHDSGVCQRQASTATVEAVAEIVSSGVAPARRMLIAFTGLAGSGKTTAAKHLVAKHGYRRTRFAEPLKAMMRALGCTEEEIDGNRKELPCELLGGATPRHAMQTLGNEWGREFIFPELWIRAWRKSIVLHPDNTVVDDARYLNEAAEIKEMGGLIVRIERPGAIGATYTHVSENQEVPFDVTIRNDASEANFLTLVDALVRNWSWAEAALND